VARVDGRRPPMKGETVWVRPQSGHVHLFDTKTGLRLGDWALLPTAALPLEGRRRALTALL